MTARIAAYQHGIYPRSEDVVAATRGLDRGRASPEEVDAAFAADREDLIAAQREAGLDYVSDGLLRWQDIFRPLVDLSGGLDARTLVRWFDNNTFFRAPEVTGDLTLAGAIPHELEDDDDIPEPRVATLPSPYLFSRAAQFDGDRNALMLALADEVLRPVAEALAGRGYRLIHLQEPWLAYHGIEAGDWDDLEKALTGIGEVTGDAALILHVYFGDAGPHVDRLRRLPVDAVGIDFVQTDPGSLGSNWEVGLVAGCLDGRTSPIESDEGTADFVQRVAETLRPPAVYLSSNCELEYLPRDVARQKVLRLGEVSARLQGATGMTPDTATRTAPETTRDLTKTPLLTHEVGSLDKLGWRVKAAAGKKLDERDIEEARSWGERVGVEGHEELLDLLRRSPLTDPADRAEVKRWSSRYAIRMEESAGLDVVYDGEQQRTEMYAWAVAHTDGFEWRGSVRAFDNKYYSKAAVTGPISLKEAYHNEEFAYLRSVARAELKVPITGAYTIADWSFDERYFQNHDLSVAQAERSAKRHGARRAFILDVARNMIQPNVEALIGLGARWIQIDEPGGSTDPHELDLFAESFNESVAGLSGAVFSTHLCFSDYNLFFPEIEAMSGCRQYCVGFANYDGRDLGVSDDARPGYGVIKKFRDLSYRPSLGLGVLDIHTDFIEPPELVRDRILYAVEVFGDPARIQVTPDCGLRTRSWDVAHRKLVNMVEGTRMAKEALGV